MSWNNVLEWSETRIGLYIGEALARQRKNMKYTLLDEHITSLEGGYENTLKKILKLHTIR